MEVRKLPGKKNRRLVRARVRVGAPLQAVWATLTDYEGLAGFIPGLSECRLLHQDKAFARLYQVDGATDEGAEVSSGQEFQTTLSYVVELEPKLWVPVRLLEGRICKEIKTNLICIREEAERIQRLLDECHVFSVITRMNPEGFLTMPLLIIVLCMLLNRECHKGELEVLLESRERRREIAFNIVDGDFKVLEGKWCVQEVDATTDEGGEVLIGQEFHTRLSYVVELEPKLWVPVRLLEARICEEIKTNLVCIREEGERVQRLLKQTELSVFLFQQ
ncbi:unnamed protein product [Triticum turgidum subsp. durum]|uniref:Coenzyme Q-binding protein COQ10 START domain-containing protein n=1 Tax=Triticum turgidum subsp. durum TaxID=4567 RepID=A0A9R1QZZ5_TRITD|nr:unnamed protein product [Triticum turgidum subsp. durum]